MKKMIVIGDIHAKNEDPFRKSINLFFDWVISNYKDSTICFCGDLFDNSSPHNKIEKDVIEKLKQLRRVIILTGNHDFSYRSGNALDPLSCFDNIEIIEERTKKIIDGKNILFLPFVYGASKEYENIVDTCDYVITHITPKECAFGDEGVDLKVNAKKIIHGHIHTQKDFVHNGVDNIVLGVPIPTRHLEDQEHRIYDLFEDKFIAVPKYFKYETIKYGDEPTSKDNILNITECPDMESAYIKYKGCYIRRDGITFRGSSESSSASFTEYAEFDLLKEFDMFCDIHGLGVDVRTCGAKNLALKII